MNKKQYRITFLIDWARNFGVIFSLAIIAMTAAGMLIKLNGRDMSELSTLFEFSKGLLYSTIMQIAGFSFIIAFFTVLLFSEHIQIKIRFFYRGFLLLLVTLVVTSVFAFIFKWFPKNNIQGWIGFLVCTIICFTISFFLTLLKLKLEGKKYAKLLAGYKARHKSPVPSPQSPIPHN